MNIQAEMSLYPLRTKRVGNIILRFAEELRANGLKPETGVMSTMVKGNCHMVFTAVERAFDACGSEGDIVLIFKASNACPECIREKKEMKHA
jgi:uncharacterized protein YqgV (UPF0045/DUF77 family)